MYPKVSLCGGEWYLSAMLFSVPVCDVTVPMENLSDWPKYVNPYNFEGINFGSYFMDA